MRMKPGKRPLQSKLATTSATGPFVLQDLAGGSDVLAVMHPQYVDRKQPFDFRRPFQLAEFKREPK